MLARSLLVSALVLANLTTAFAAESSTFGQVDVKGSLPGRSVGYDSGILLSGIGIVRVSASGSITLANGGCDSALTPDGCGVDPASVDLMAPHQLKFGTLVAAFTDINNALVTTRLSPIEALSEAMLHSRSRREPSYL